jgi:hypothetical protein
MGKSTIRLLLNCIRAPECVVAFEPEGATITLREGAPVRVEITGAGEPLVEVSYWPDGISVDAWPGADTRAWDAHGNELPI